jgi:hypothetical protein
MRHLTTALRAVAAAAALGSCACLGTAIAVADPTASSADLSTLAGSLSKGYTADSCKPGTLSSGVLAEYDCGQSPDSSGPAAAIYQLFGNSTDLAAAFTSNINGMSLTGCGDSNSKSPTTWNQGSGTAGQVACGPHEGAATITWTIDAKKVLGHVRASNADAAALYKWWQSNG